MNIEETQKAAVAMRKELEDIVKNKEQLIFTSAKMVNQLKRLRKQLRDTKNEVMAMQNKQASSCLCFNHKVAPDRVSVCLQESKSLSHEAPAVKLPAGFVVASKAKPDFKTGPPVPVVLHGDTTDSDTNDLTDNDDAVFAPPPKTTPKRKQQTKKPTSKTKRKTSKARGAKPKQQQRRKKLETSDSDDEEEGDDDDINDTLLTSDV